MNGHSWPVGDSSHISTKLLNKVK